MNSALAQAFPLTPSIVRAVPIVLLVLIAWSLLWKGLALWRAARRKEVVWFVVLLLLNTLGILDIVYYFFVAKSDVKQGVE